MLLLWCKGLSHYWDLDISTQSLTSGKGEMGWGGRDGEGRLNEEEMEGKRESDGKGNEREIGGREDKRKGWKSGDEVRDRGFCCMDRNRKGQEAAAAAAAREATTRHYQWGERRGELGTLDKSWWWRFDSVAVKEIESALGNKTMNDASKKRLSYWGWEWEWVGGGGGRLKREFHKKGREKRRATKEEWRITADGSKRRKRWNEGAICEIRGNGEELFLDQCDRKWRWIREGWMKKVMCAWAEKESWRGGRKVGNMATEKEKEGLMKTEDGSLFCQPLPPVDWSSDLARLHARTNTHTHGGNGR